MGKKLLLALVIILFAIGLWYVLAGQNSAMPPAAETANTSAVQVPTQPANTPAQTATITYTDSGFSPSVLTVAKGTTVTFTNNASNGVWPASNPHPIHNRYPTTGGCISSTFDACRSIPSGGSWSFTFNIAGSWGYHNHLNPSEGGTVVVQ